MTILNGYQPAHVVRYFEEICAIPHPSHHEQALCAYIRGARSGTAIAMWRMLRET